MSSSKNSSYDPISKIWCGPSRPSIYNTEVGLGYIILNVLKQNPDRVMQICDDSGAEMTCGEMHTRIAKISTYLSSKTELKQGDVVGIIARNSENVAPVAFACFTLGLPINPLANFLSASDILDMYSKTKPKIIFCDFDVVEKVCDVIRKIENYNCKIFTLMGKAEGIEFVDDILRDFYGNVDEFEPPVLPNISSTPLTINSSSGTTGSIKGIVRSHKHWLDHMSSIIPEPLGTNSFFLAPATLHWSTSVNVLLYSVLYQFKRVITTKAMTSNLFMDIIERYNITSIFGSTYLYFQFTLSGRVFPNIKEATIGGAVITKELMANIKTTFPNATLKTGYASTESDILTFCKISDKLDTSGVVWDNTEMKIIDDHDNLLGPNERGQICYRKLTVFDGYYGDPEATKLAFDPDGWCYTGDVGYFDDEGYIFVIDRVKHMLKYNQIIITPLEIESIINEIEGVLASCVVGVYDEGNDIIHAFVIKDERKVDLSEKFIENYVNEKVIDVKRIRGGVHFVKEFPMTPTGKVKNRELREVAEKIYKEGKK